MRAFQPQRIGGQMGRLLMMVVIFAWGASVAYAQVPPAAIFSTYFPNFFNLQEPGTLSLTIFGGGFVSDQYAVTQEGFQFEQSITRYIGAVVRTTGYQLFMGQGFADPLAPSTGHSARFNFGRFQGGVDLTVWNNTHLYLLGGGDAGDSNAADIEGDLSTWLIAHSRHPLNLLVSAVHDYQNGVTSSSIDLRTVLASTEDYLLMAGGGGAIYGGGFVSSVAGQGGPDLGLYYRPWHAGIDAQAGYGTAHQYGQIILYKQFNWVE
ncbi:MAG TPA: hypothetical protein VKV28_00425 [Candidatus Binataceae bacterium]|nr:hypothetical protein [Candidatus Binataceae bacterium]